jgi:hypothetical protein
MQQERQAAGEVLKGLPTTSAKIRALAQAGSALRVFPNPYQGRDKSFTLPHSEVFKEVVTKYIQ